MKHLEKIKEILKEYAIDNDTFYEGTDEDIIDFVRESGEIIQKNYIRKARHWIEFEIIKKFDDYYIRYVDAETTDDFHAEEKGFEYDIRDLRIVTPTRETIKKIQLYEQDVNYD